MTRPDRRPDLNTRDGPVLALARPLSDSPPPPAKQQRRSIAAKGSARRCQGR